MSAAFAASDAERVLVSANSKDCPPSLTESAPKSTGGPLIVGSISNNFPSCIVTSPPS